MTLVDPASLPHVLDPGVVSALGDELVAVGNTVVAAASEAREHWSGLRDAFDVSGAEGAFLMLDRPQADAAAFAQALGEARNALWEAASGALPSLQARRDELAARIVTVNSEYDAAESTWQQADAAYRTQRNHDAESDATTRARADRLSAAVARDKASGAAAALRDDIERFRRDVESTEQQLAARLTGITGGDEVHAARGEPLRVSQSFWGYVDAPYPGAPAAATTVLTLADRLRASLSSGLVTRIDWLATAPPDQVRAWVAGHPDFPSAVGFVDPERAARLWTSLATDSTLDAGSGAWTAGPLAQLLALAPLAIGNLNGAPAAERDTFARAGLAQLLADDSLDGGAREKLQSLSRVIGMDDVNLLSVFLDTDGEPRAALAWGDVDTASQITTMSHGIQTDLAGLREWRATGVDMKTALDEQLSNNGSSATTAVVLFMEWDSGDAFTVQAIDRPDAGAARLDQLLTGFAHANPSAQRNLVVHSLGTTMGAQAIADNPGLVDNAWFVGSAGITEDAATQISRQVSAGTLSVHATHASADWIAPLGRTDLLSEHPVDPRSVSGVDVFGSDGGFVSGYGPSGAYGDPTEGHNAQQSDDILYWGLEGWTTGVDGSAVPQFDTVSTGYFDPTAQSFLQLVVDLAESAEGARVP